MSRHAPYGGAGKARRYCGSVKIVCRYSDRMNQYECEIVPPGARRRKKFYQFVGVPPSSRLAVDSPAAFDDAARAAISFAVDDGMADESDLDFGDNGPVIRRKK